MLSEDKTLDNNSSILNLCFWYFHTKEVHFAQVQSVQFLVLLVNLLVLALPPNNVREQSERRGERQRDERVIFPLMLCSFEPWRKKKRERDRERELFISGQMRGVWLLLVWVCPEERNISKQEEHYNSRTVHVFKHSLYFMNLLALVWSESHEGEKLIAFFSSSHLWFYIQRQDVTGGQMKGYLKKDDSRDTVKPSDFLSTQSTLRCARALKSHVHTWVLTECSSLSMQKNKEGVLCQSVSRGDRA